MFNLNKEISGFRLSIVEFKEEKRSHLFWMPLFSFCKLIMLSKHTELNPFQNKDFTLYLLENLLLFFFVQFHCVEPTHKEVTFCSKWRSFYIFAVKKTGTAMFVVFFVWRKFIILNASKATKQLEWRKRKIPQL